MESFIPRMVDTVALERIGRELLAAIGENPDRDGIKETPARFAKWWTEFLQPAPQKLATSFAAEGVDQVVCLSGIRVWSLCEHHLLPFYADMAIAYIPQGRIIGLSKLGRIAKHYARNLQVQERLVEQIANHVQHATHSPHVAVRASGVHLCMIMRGVEMPGLMTTQVLRGAFFDNAQARAEFTAMAGRASSAF